MKRLLATIFIVIFSASTAFASGTLPFVNNTYGEHFEAVYWMKEWGGFHGYPDGTFRGDSEINRAEMVKVLVLSTGVTEEEIDEVVASMTEGFTDVDPQDRDSIWYIDYILYAKDQGIVSGHPNGSFKPGDPVLTSELFKLVVKSQYGTPDSSYEGDIWYELYANLLKEYDIMEDASHGNGYSFTWPFPGQSICCDGVGFNTAPASKVTRAGAAELIYRIRILLEDGEFVSNYYPLISLEDYEEEYEPSIVEEDGNITIEDTAFGYDLTFDLQDHEQEDVEVYIINPSGFENGYETIIQFLVGADNVQENLEEPRRSYDELAEITIE